LEQTLQWMLNALKKETLVWGKITPNEQNGVMDAPLTFEQYEKLAIEQTFFRPNFFQIEIGYKSYIEIYLNNFEEVERLSQQLEINIRYHTAHRFN
jgi:hypothetical protein